MRKIGSEKEIERKRKRNTLLISFFLLGVLVIGTVGYGFIYGPRSSNQDYQENLPDNAIAFGEQIFYLSHSRTQVAKIQTEITNTINDYIGYQLYIVSDNQAVTLELASTIGKYSSKVQEACFGACEKDLPEKTCNENLIIFKESESIKIFQENNCIFIEGDSRAVDAFIYDILDTN